MSYFFGSQKNENEFGELKQVVSAPLSEALLCVDTRDGLNYDKQTGLYVNPRNPFEIEMSPGQLTGKIRRLALKEINLTYNVPNVNPTNNVLWIEGSTGIDGPGSTPIPIVITPGDYLPTELATTIQSALNAGSGVLGSTDWAVNYDVAGSPFYNTFTIFKNSDGTYKYFRINPNIGGDNGSSSEGGVITVRTDNLSTMMGFNNQDGKYSQAVYSSFATMLPTTYIDVVSSYMTKHQSVIDKSTSARTGNNLLARLYISPERFYSITNTNIIGTRPFMLHKEFSNPKIINWDENDPINNISVNLLDDKGNILYAPAYNYTYETEEAVVKLCGNSGFVQMTFSVSEAMGQ